MNRSTVGLMIQYVLRAQRATSTVYPSRTAIVRPVSPLARWLLGCAVFCLVAQSTLLPIAAPWASVWDPGHGHLTLRGTVPEHEHVYGGSSSAEVGCHAPSDVEGVANEDAHGLACAASSEGTVSPGIVSIAVLGTATGAAVLEVGMLPLPAAVWTSAVVDVTPPPPRVIT